MKELRSQGFLFWMMGSPREIAPMDILHHCITTTIIVGWQTTIDALPALLSYSQSVDLMLARRLKLHAASSKPSSRSSSASPPTSSYRWWQRFDWVKFASLLLNRLLLLTSDLPPPNDSSPCFTPSSLLMLLGVLFITLVSSWRQALLPCSRLSSSSQWSCWGSWYTWLVKRYSQLYGRARNSIRHPVLR